MTQLVAALVVTAVYGLFVLVKPDRRCPRCNGWGQKQKRRRPKACPRCAGTGKTFWPGAGLVHKAVARTMKHMRDRAEGK